MAQYYVSSGFVNSGYFQTGITINWLTKVIFVPKFYLTYISGTTYQLDTNKFRNDLKELEDGVVGMAYPDTHRHNTQVVLSGITYARVIEIINGYTVTFEDGLYAVNLVGSNNNIPDVLNLNSVSVRASNSAGLQIVNTTGGVGTPSEVANAVWNALQSNYLINGSMGKALSTAGNAADPWAADLSTYNTAGTAGKIVKDSSADITIIKNQTDTLETATTNLQNTVDNLPVPPSSNDIATAVWNKPIEATFTAEEILKIAAAVLAGKVSGAGTGSEVFTGLDGTTIRVISNNDSNGNRTSVTTNGA